MIQRRLKSIFFLKYNPLHTEKKNYQAKGTHLEPAFPACFLFDSCIKFKEISILDNSVVIPFEQYFKF